MPQQYSHRNGETEPPTEPGHFWLVGRQELSLYTNEPTAVNYLSDVVSVPSNAVVEEGSLVISRGNVHLRYEGKWWGPIVSPWDTDAA